VNNNKRQILRVPKLSHTTEATEYMLKYTDTETQEPKLSHGTEATE